MPKAELVKVQTPKKFILKGLYFQQPQSQATVIFIHGLGSSVFGSSSLVMPLAELLEKNNFDLLAINNRGHDSISKLNKIDQRKRKGLRSQPAGAAHEVFADCVDDIQGMVEFAKQQGTKKLFLVGHSTGCQKSIFYLSRRGKQQQIASVILLCPLSDYADAVNSSGDELKSAIKQACQLIAQDRASQLLPPDVWESEVDAQRFLSLYTPNSGEEIFCYATKSKIPATFRKVKIPILAVFAEKDQYRDRSTKRLVTWFTKNTNSVQFSSEIIPDTDHNFTGHEAEVAAKIINWLRMVNDRP